MQKCHFRLHTDNFGSLISLQLLLPLFSCFASKPKINDEKYLSKLCFSVFMELAFFFWIFYWFCSEVYFFCITYVLDKILSTFQNAAIFYSLFYWIFQLQNVIKKSIDLFEKRTRYSPSSIWAVCGIKFCQRLYRTKWSWNKLRFGPTG